MMGFFAWLTRNPDAELVRQAEDWPVVGSWATWFRDRYLPPPAAEDGNAEGAFTPESFRPEGWAPENRTRETDIESPDIIWVLPGAVLRREPAASSPAVYEFDAVTTVIRLGRRGDWFLIRDRGSRGWVYLEGYDEQGGPPYGEAPEPTKALMPRSPDAASLAAARELLGERERVGSLGPYVAYSDLDESELWSYLDGLAAQVETLYSKRYGLEPLGNPAAALVVYRGELAYRLLEKRSPRIAGLHSTGHASRGVAVLFVGDRSLDEVGTTLVHELVHFLNRRAIGPALPPWIDEGLADDLATADVDAGGRIRPGELSGDRSEAGGRLVIDGALATLYRLRGAAAGGELLPFARLTSLQWEEFVRSQQRQLLYGTSAFWVRYLLDSGEPGLAAGFRRFLAAVGAGKPATPEMLRDYLGRDWAALDEGFLRWLETHPALPSEPLTPVPSPTRSRPTGRGAPPPTPSN